jgi:hypothetical protein
VPTAAESVDLVVHPGLDAHGQRRVLEVVSTEQDVTVGLRLDAGLLLWTALTAPPDARQSDTMSDHRPRWIHSPRASIRRFLAWMNSILRGRYSR